jgi:hypothetical protein
MPEDNRWLYWLSLLFTVILSFVVKFNALNNLDAPPSADYGKYLCQVNIIQGYDPRGFGLQSPPLFFLLLNAFLLFFDTFVALKLVASFVFSLAAIPFFLFVEKICGSRLAALISAWLFVYFEGYSEMIAWGGNPNFLGFSFMLLALTYVIDSFRNSNKRNMLLAGVFLSLAIGTHFLVAFFLFLLLLFYVFSKLMFYKAKFGIIKPLLLSLFIAVVLSLPYIPPYLAFFKHSSSTLVRFNIAEKLMGIPIVLASLFEAQHLTYVVIALLGVFALVKYTRENRDNGLLLCALFILPFILALLTKYPERWFYFLPIPLFTCFGLYLKNLFGILKNAEKEILLLALCFIIVMGAEITIVSIDHLRKATTYYQVIYDDELQALNWVKNCTAPNSIFATTGSFKGIGAGGNSYGWWIEGYSKRKCFSSGDPEFFSYDYEREEVDVANRIFAGNYLFEFNGMRVSESFPSDMGNPEIAVLIDGNYQNVLFLNDGEQELVFSPLENQQITYREAPFYANNKELMIYYNETFANVTSIYEWSRMKLIRTVTMNVRQFSIDVAFNIFPINSTLRLFKICLWPSFYTSLENFEIKGSTISLYIRTHSNKIVKAKVSLVRTNGELNGTVVFFKDPKYSMPMAMYSLKPLQDILSVHIRISIATNNMKSQMMQFCNSYSLMDNLRIDYIFLNKKRVNEFHRFLNDPKHFKIVFQNETIVIFMVKREEVD